MSTSTEDKNFDYEKGEPKVIASDANSEVHEPVFGSNTLHRQMKNRHIAMIRCVASSVCVVHET